MLPDQSRPHRRRHQSFPRSLDREALKTIGYSQQLHIIKICDIDDVPKVRGAQSNLAIGKFQINQRINYHVVNIKLHSKNHGKRPLRYSTRHSLA